MIKAFRISTPPDIEEMFRIISDMRDVLDALAHKEVPDATYTRGDLEDYCRSLVNGQRGSLGRTKPGSWSVAEHDHDMPADARVDFVFVPTYIAVATLTRVRTDFPDLSAGIDGYDSALKDGMVFCTYRELEGAGYDATKGLIDAALIFAEGSVAEFLTANPGFCPPLLTTLKKVKRELVARLASGQTRGPWGEEYGSDFLSVVETLKLISIPGMEDSITQGMQESLDDCKKEIEW